MVGTGGIPGATVRADLYMAAVVQGETAAKYVNAADPLPLKWVLCSAELVGVPLVCNGRIDRIAVLEPVEAPTGLPCLVRLAVEKAIRSVLKACLLCLRMWLGIGGRSATWNIIRKRAVAH